MRKNRRFDRQLPPSLRAAAGALFLFLLAPLAGCDNRRELTRMQAEVNQAATELVRQEAEARRQWMETQKRLDNDRRDLDKNRRQLADERRTFLLQARRDPIVAQAILQIGGITLCLLPLLVTVRLLRRGDDDPVLPPLDELMLNELIDLETPLLPGPTEPRPRDLNALIEQRLSQPND